MDDTEIAVRVKVVNEVEFLLASEPREPLQPRSIHVVFLIKQNMDVKGRCTRSRVNHEEIEGHYDVRTPSDQKRWNEEVGRVVAFVTEVRCRDEMILGIVGVMEVDVIAEQLTADGMVAKLVVHQGLGKRHDQVRRDGDHEIQQYRWKQPRRDLDHLRCPSIEETVYLTLCLKT